MLRVGYKLAGGGLRPSEVLGSSTSTIIVRAKCLSEMSCSPVNELEKADKVLHFPRHFEHSDGLVELLLNFPRVGSTIDGPSRRDWVSRFG